jgi:hypothetical protein
VRRATLLSACTVLLVALPASAQGVVLPPAPAVAPVATTTPARGWIGVEQRDVLGVTALHATNDYGVGLIAGEWFAGEHAQPIVEAGWSRVTGISNGDTVDVFRWGGKLALGSAMTRERLWMGGAAGLVVQAGRLHGPSNSLAWAASPSLSGIIQGRLARRLLVGGEVGVEHSIPHLSWNDFSIFNSFRLTLAVQFGVILGDPLP